MKYQIGDIIKPDRIESNENLYYLIVGISQFSKIYYILHIPSNNQSNMYFHIAHANYIKVS